MKDTSFELGKDHVVIPRDLFQAMAAAFWGGEAGVPFDAEVEDEVDVDDVHGADIDPEELLAEMQNNRRFVPLNKKEGDD